MKWLLQNSNRRIVFFVRDNTEISKSKAARLKFNRDKRKILSQHSVELSEEDYQKIESQVIVILNSDIFDFKGYRVKKITENDDKYIDFSKIQEINRSTLSVLSKEKEILDASRAINKNYNLWYV